MTAYGQFLVAADKRADVGVSISPRTRAGSGLALVRVGNEPTWESQCHLGARTPDPARWVRVGNEPTWESQFFLVRQPHVLQPGARRQRADVGVSIRTTGRRALSSRADVRVGNEPTWESQGSRKDRRAGSPNGVRAGHEPAWESQRPAQGHAARRRRHVRAGHEPAWESQLVRHPRMHQPVLCVCAPDMSRRGSLNGWATPVTGSTISSCAPDMSRRGSLNHILGINVPQKFRCAPDMSRRGSLNHILGINVPQKFRCAPDMSRRGSFNFDEYEARNVTPSEVRAGHEPAWESQRQLLGMGALAGRSVRAGHEPAWESQRVVDRLHGGAQAWCAPDMSRRGSLNADFSAGVPVRAARCARRT